MRKFTRLAMMTLVLLFAPILLSAQPIFTDATRSARERAEDIVKHMTLEEKVALMIYNSPSVERLGIRNYNWWNEALHGIARNGNATVFPMPIAMAASFDTELLEQVFTSISDEGRIKWVQARAANDSDMWYKGLSYWTPNINIFRDLVLYGNIPGFEIWLTGALVALISLAAGALIFRKMQRKFILYI